MPQLGLHIRKTLFILVLGFSSPLYGADSLSSHIERQIKAKGLKKSSLGLVISKIKKDRSISPLYSLNSSELFIPASLTKIASLSALHSLYPPSYTFKTSLVSSAPVVQGVLKGDLILKGGGDSSFTSESLWNLINNFKRSGIKHIHGNLLVDASLYKKEPSLPYSERSYLAPSSASSFNWNSVAFYIRPAKTLKQPALVFADPENSYIQIINKVKTAKKTHIQIKRKSTSSKEIFEIKGKIGRHEKELVRYRNIQRPALWLGYNALSFLKDRGITVSGSVKKGKCSGSCQSLAEWESRPITFHFYNLMKYSSNLVSRMLVSHLPLLDKGQKGDLQKGMKKIRQHLKSKEGLQHFHLEDSSGLSRKNRFRPRDLQKIMIRSLEQPYSAEMLFSYPLARGKGTLEDRFKTLPRSAFVRAKTGSLAGVMGLAGWTGDADKKENYAFVFIFNGKMEEGPKAQAFFDEIILYLLNKK